MTCTRSARTAAVLALGATGALALAQTSVTNTTTFDNGMEGWVGPEGPGGATGIEATGGNPGAYLRTVFNNFGITFANSSNPDFFGDFTAGDEAVISVDIRVEFLNFFGQDVSRPWLVELRDFDSAQGGFPWTSVWFLFDNISQANNAEWTTYSVTFDPASTDLPAGWAGYGDEDPNTFEPRLPEGVTFADVLAGVDEIAFTTFQPGFFFGFTDHTVGIDNLSITRGVPCDADDNRDGAVNVLDIVSFVNAWNAMDLRTDLDRDRMLTVLDVIAFIDLWNAGCP